MSTQVEIVDRKVLLTTVREQVPKQNLIHRTLAPFKDTDSREVLVDILLEAGVEIAPYRSPDAPAKLGGWDFNEQIMIGICDIAKKRRLNHDIMMQAGIEMREPGQLAGGVAGILLGNARKGAEAKVFEAAAKNRVDIDVRLEKQALDALQGRVIATSTDGLIFDVNYGIPAAQDGWDPTDHSHVYWSDVAADILGQIELIKVLVRDEYGLEIVGCYMPSGILTYASKNTAFRDTYKNVGQFVTGPQRAKEIIQSENQITIQVYDTSYPTVTQNPVTGAWSRTRTRYAPDHRVIFYANPDDGEPLLQTLTAPHFHADWATGFYSWQTRENDPVSIEVGAGIQAFPWLRVPSAVVTADVLAH